MQSRGLVEETRGEALTKRKTELVGLQVHAAYCVLLVCRCMCLSDTCKAQHPQDHIAMHILGQ